MLNKNRKDGKYEPLVGGQDITQSKRQLMVSKSTIRTSKNLFSLDQLDRWGFEKIPNIHLSNKRMNAQPTSLRFDQERRERNGPSGWHH